ncbi:hypothetical protein K435DRAFT_858600 [Dendrothele bispora CBS 962.96]|uniref:Uncharacterized protein n=1 Tax=Dendrothele bispora (strain CBS 962.96) TaxID=1314807 RepID=A0A4S8M2N8_DENBC|nr:hypothetical protein K435DRAFT_858600 [Dendrothele bispora CBS 962.96]
MLADEQKQRRCNEGMRQEAIPVRRSIRNGMAANVASLAPSAQIHREIAYGIPFPELSAQIQDFCTVAFTHYHLVACNATWFVDLEAPQVVSSTSPMGVIKTAALSPLKNGGVRRG